MPQSPPRSFPETKPFEFTVATLVQTKTGWEIKRKQQQAYRFIEYLAEDVPLEMVAIPGGTFLMGSCRDEPGHNSCEEPQHKVTVPPFFLGRYLITQKQWQAVIADETYQMTYPPRFVGEDLPVDQVFRVTAESFCQQLSMQTGLEYRLPSEAEWEYACRASTTTPFSFGATLTAELANYRGSGHQRDGLKDEHRGKTTSVSHFGVSNAFGLSDMHGNVCELCKDTWQNNYNGAPTDGSAWIDPRSSFYPYRAGRSVLRGGSWNHGLQECRSASRTQIKHTGCVGMRVCSSGKAYSYSVPLSL